MTDEARLSGESGRAEPVVMGHTQTSTNGHGPDYCFECSEAITDWVKWPCPFMGGYLAAIGGIERAKAAILDIDAHATPYGEDDDGFVNGGYLISVGSLHRALGVVGHSAAKCPACEARDHDCKALVNETNEPLDPVQACLYWQGRLADAQVFIVDLLDHLDRGVKMFRKTYASSGDFAFRAREWVAEADRLANGSDRPVIFTATTDQSGGRDRSGSAGGMSPTGPGQQP